MSQISTEQRSMSIEFLDEKSRQICLLGDILFKNNIVLEKDIEKKQSKKML